VYNFDYLIWIGSFTVATYYVYL